MGKKSKKLPFALAIKNSDDHGPSEGSSRIFFAGGTSLTSMR